MKKFLLLLIVPLLFSCEFGGGTYTFANGDKYVGEWKDGKFIGKIESEGNTDFWGSYDGKWTYYNADGTIKEVKEF